MGNLKKLISTRKYLLLAVIVFVLMLLGVFIAFIFKSNMNKEEKKSIAPVSTLTKVVEKSVPTATITVEDTTLSFDELDTIPPDDVFREIAYFGAGGGGCWGNCTCETFNADNDHPNFLPYPYNDEEIRIYDRIIFQICGIDVSKPVNVDVILPDGSRKTFQQGALELFTYIPKLGDPIGRYRFVFSGEGWSLQDEVQVYEPHTPSLFFVSNQELIFFGFLPKEEVRLLVYTGDGQRKFIGWKYLTVGEDGSLVLRIDDTPAHESVSFAVLSDKFGQVFSRREGWSDWGVFEIEGNTVGGFDLGCKNAFDVSHLNPRGYAIIASDVLPVYAYSETLQLWEKAQDINGLQGKAVRLISTPNCFNDSYMWMIECQYKACQSMYVPEFDENVRHLEPIQDLGEEIYKQTFYECRFAPVSRLAKGARGRITYSDGSPLNLRKTPGLNSEALSAVPEGEKFSVIDQPKCIDNFVWWNVDFGNGLTGWVAEGDKDSYFIEPFED